MITGGVNASPKNLALQVTATDGANYVDTYGGGGGGDGPEGVYPPASGANGFNLVNEGSLGDKTFSITWFAGPVGINPSLNNYPPAPAPFFQDVPGCALQAMYVTPTAIYAMLPGWFSAAAGSGPLLIYEIAPGDEGWGSRDAADSIRKDPTLNCWRTSGVDWDGVTATNLPGEKYGIKLRKGISGTERIWAPMCQMAAFDRDTVSPAMLARVTDKTVTFNCQWWSPTANTARPFIFDGATYHCGSYFVSGSFNLQEISVSLPTNATDCRAGVETTGNAGDIHYSTQWMSPDDGSIGTAYVPFEGWMSCLFQTHPLKYLVASPAVLGPQIIRMEMETNGNIPDNVRMLLCDIQASGAGSMDLVESPDILTSGLSLFTTSLGPAATSSSMQAMRQFQVQTPGGLFVSPTLTLLPNPPNSPPWSGTTLGISGVMF